MGGTRIRHVEPTHAGDIGRDGAAEGKLRRLADGHVLTLDFQRHGALLSAYQCRVDRWDPRTAVVWHADGGPVPRARCLVVRPRTAALSDPAWVTGSGGAAADTSCHASVNARTHPSWSALPSPQTAHSSRMP